MLGTGGAALTAAVVAAEEGARVGVFEKHKTVGGTTVYSGGMIWIPLNQHEPEEKGDTREKAVAYLKAISNGTTTDELIETYVDRGAEMVAYLHDRTPVQFYALPDFPDYHPEQVGAMGKGGRSLETPLFPYGELGEWKDRVHISPYYPTYHLTIGQTTLGQAVPDEISAEEMQRRIDNDERGMGLALGGRLLKALLDRGVEPQTEHRGVDLIIEDGKVAGVVFETPEGREEVRAPNVVIATGGFEQNAELKKAFLRGPCTHTVAVETNTGDGLKMAMRAGAMLGNMGEAWWMPMIEVPTWLVETGQQLLTYERTLPHAIMVNRYGKRFTNEAANYNAFGAAFHEQDTIMGDLQEPALLARLRPDLARPLRLRRRPRRHREGVDGLDPVGRHARGPRREARHPGRCAQGDHRAVQRERARARGPRLQPRLERAGPVVGRPHAARRHPARLARSRGGPALLRDRGQERCAGHQGRAADRHPRARARPRGRRHRGPVRGRQRHGLAHGDDLRRRGRHARAGDDLRLHRRTRHRRARRAGGRGD